MYKDMRAEWAEISKFKEPISVLNELVQSFYSQKTILITTILSGYDMQKTLGQDMTRHYLESSIAYAGESHPFVQMRKQIQEAESYAQYHTARK